RERCREQRRRPHLSRAAGPQRGGTALATLAALSARQRRSHGGGEPERSLVDVDLGGASGGLQAAVAARGGRAVSLPARHGSAGGAAGAAGRRAARLDALVTPGRRRRRGAGGPR